MASETVPETGGYDELLREIVERIHSARMRAAIAVHQEQIFLYWQIGRGILERQSRQGWGAKVIDRLAADLRSAFPEQQGLSPRNLKYMRAFAEAWADFSGVREVLGQLTWHHNLTLIEKLDDPAERLWYARKTIEYGWSRNVLVHQIEGGLIHRQGKGLNNFARTLPSPRSDLVRDLLKDPYSFDFLTLEEARREHDLERALTAHIRDFLLELGVGFAFVGRQYRLEVGGQEFFIDLLFYHLRLRCFVVLDLKISDFKPEFAGKMNFYLSVADDLLRQPGDEPSIGIILCKDRNDVVVEYALRDTAKPIGVSTYLGAAASDSLRRSLPSADQLSAEVAAWFRDSVDSRVDP